MHDTLQFLTGPVKLPRIDGLEAKAICTLCKLSMSTVTEQYTVTQRHFHTLVQRHLHTLTNKPSQYLPAYFTHLVSIVLDAPTYRDCVHAET